MRWLAGVVVTLALPGAATAAITRIDFTGSGVVTYNSGGEYFGSVIPPAPIKIGDRVKVSGTLRFADGSDPFGPAVVPDGFTGTVALSQDDVFDGTVGFSFVVSGGDVGDDTFTHHYPYASGYAVLTHGHLSGLDIGTDDDPDTNELSTTGFAYAFGDSGVAHGGTWTLDAAGAVPEPATWGLLGIGFVGVGLAARRRDARPEAEAA